MKRINTYSLFFILFILITACTNGTSEEIVTNTPEEPTVTGVSVWDRISSRSEPRRSSASTTLLSLGESFLYLDSSAIDSAYNNTRFLKAQLSDSSIVWVYGFASVLNAKPGVITKNVPLYLRPDLLTITENELKAMEIVAVTEEWDNWIRVVNEKKANVGWIKNDFITYNRIDLAFALLAKRKLNEDDREQKIQAIEDLLSNNPYPNSIFIPEVRERLDDEKELLWEEQGTGIGTGSAKIRTEEEMIKVDHGSLPKSPHHIQSFRSWPDVSGAGPMFQELVRCFRSWSNISWAHLIF